MPDDTRAKPTVADEPSVPAKDPKLGPEQATVPAPAADAPDGEDEQLTPDEERELGRLLEKRAAAESAGDVVNFKVEEPHSEMTFAGVTVGRDFTPVPRRIANHFANAAADAGVTLTREN